MIGAVSGQAGPDSRLRGPMPPRSLLLACTLACGPSEFIAEPQSTGGVLDVSFEDVSVEVVPRSGGILELRSSDGSCEPALLLTLAGGNSWLELPLQATAPGPVMPFELEGSDERHPTLHLTQLGPDQDESYALWGGEGEVVVDREQYVVQWQGAMVSSGPGDVRPVDGEVTLSFLWTGGGPERCLQADAEADGWCVLAGGLGGADTACR